jgi:hypothetical protein
MCEATTLRWRAGRNGTAGLGGAARSAGRIARRWRRHRGTASPAGRLARPVKRRFPGQFFPGMSQRPALRAAARRTHPVTREPKRWRSAPALLGLVDRFSWRLGASLLTEFAVRTAISSWPTAALVMRRRGPGGRVAVLIVDQDARRATRSGPTPRYGGRPRMTWLTSDYGSDSSSSEQRSHSADRSRRPDRPGPSPIDRHAALETGWRLKW